MSSKCNYCEEDIVGKRSDAKYCSDRCRDTEEKRRHRERKDLLLNPKRGSNTGRTADRPAYSLMYKFGITTDQYDELLAKQNDSCAFCERHKDEFAKRLAVDHNHKTGEIRGLLCAYCNHRVVGNHTDGNKLRRMADYIEQGTGWYVPPKKKKRVRKRKEERDT